MARSEPGSESDDETAPSRPEPAPEPAQGPRGLPKGVSSNQGRHADRGTREAISLVEESTPEIHGCRRALPRDAGEAPNAPKSRTNTLDEKTPRKSLPTLMAWLGLSSDTPCRET
jgi:hypothetical protein